MESSDKDLNKNKKRDESDEYNRDTYPRVRSVNEDAGKDNEIVEDACVTTDLENVNKNNLKVMEFYSADDIRQTMKTLLTEKSTQNRSEIVHKQMLRMKAKPEPINEFNDCSQKSLPLKQNQMQSDTQKYVSEEQTGFGKEGSHRENGYGKRTRGRPPKAGPSKVSKKIRKTDFYIGKLSNVVSFRTQCDDSPSNSDSESDLFY